MNDYLYEAFRKDNVINIFCDASTNGQGNNLKVCYGAIVVNKDKIIDSDYRINIHSTSVRAEAKAVLLGVYLATKYQDKFPVINIFSDSQVTVFNLRDRIYNWKCNNGILYNKSNDEVANQSIYIEIVNVIHYYNLKLNYFHQKGHVNANNIKSLNESLNVFSRSNYINTKKCLAFGRYISKYNNMVDAYSRKILQKNQYFYTNETINPFIFQIDRNKLDNYREKIITKGDENYEQ